METFIKSDGEKPMMSLITPAFAVAVLGLFSRPEHKSVTSSCIDIAQRFYDDEAWAYKIDDNLLAIKRWYDTPAHMLEAVARVLTFGAAKYDRNNWKKCDEVWRYEDALHRHMLELLKGKTNDSESGLHHMDHVLCNMMFLEYFS